MCIERSLSADSYPYIDVSFMIIGPKRSCAAFRILWLQSLQAPGCLDVESSSAPPARICNGRFGICSVILPPRLALHVIFPLREVDETVG